jgi:hypothetical protein
MKKDLVGTRTLVRPHTQMVPWNASLGVLVCVAFSIMLARTVTDPDLWGHLRFGLDMLESGGISSVDPYSYLTAGHAWINHEWLAEVTFGLAWTAGRSGGLIVLKMIVGGATLLILYAHLLSMRIHAMRAAILLLFFSLGLLPFLQAARPQMFTFLFFALLSIIIYRAEQGDYRWLWAVPLIIALWANMHGGFLAGIGLIGIWAVLHLVHNWRAWRRLVPPLLIVLLAINLNPYGVRLPIFLLRTATVPRPFIQDWQPVTLASPEGVVWLLATAVWVMGVALSARPRNPRLIGLSGLMALLPWLAIRNLPLYSIAALIFTSEHIASAWDAAAPTGSRQPIFRTAAAALPLLLSVLLVGLGWLMDFRQILDRDPETPVAAVALLKQSGTSGNLAVDFDWGEYAIWHLGPRIKVSIDGRRETVYTDEVYDQNVSFMLGIGEWDALLEQYPTDMALVKKSRAVYNLLRLDPNWVLAYSDEYSALFARKGSALLQTLQHTTTEFSPPPRTGYFP